MSEKVCRCRSTRCHALVSAGMVNLATASSAFAYPPAPYFDQPFYSVTIDVSPPGLQSFEITGFAADHDRNETVTIGLGGPAPWSYFSSVPGNPATFTFGGRNLNYNHIGTYVFGLGADDNLPPTTYTDTIIRVTIVPEPVSSVVLIATMPFACSRRRLR